MEPLIDIRDLRIRARTAEGPEIEIVKGVSFSVRRGEVMGLIGESGSGKTTIALATMGYARYGCRIAGGTIRIGETEVTRLDGKGLQQLRGRKVAYIAQSAAASFNPSRPIMAQVIESALIHGLMDEPAAREKAIGLFRAMAIPHPETIGNRYPHQVSGGQLQRLMAAMALITDPDVVIFDEPTTALDVTTQIEVLKAFKEAIRDRNTTGIYVTHDLAVIAQIADSITVLRHGEVQEIATTPALLASPAHEYSRKLLAAAEPALRASPVTGETSAPLLRVSGMSAGYGLIGKDGMPAVLVLRDIELTIGRGHALGVIGESGCGKSTLARVIAGLTPASRGTVTLDGVDLAPGIAGRSREQLREIQLVFQMADTALNPKVPIDEIIGRPLTFFFGMKGAERERRVRELLDLTHLPASVRDRLPGDLSGGQKQRVNFARALAAQPKLLLCDEVTSALDTVVAAAILDLMVELRRELGLTTMFISHDLKTIRAICDDIMVLYSGRVVETMPAAALETGHHHPYAGLLLGSVPALRTDWLETTPAASLQVQGVPPALSSGGCAFFPRCPRAEPGLCDTAVPPLRPVPGGIEAACFRLDAA
ncbi:MAG: ABC transporter ATP-binding protein [Beijerinckiaceae bacterium]|nr:ABC transporter ATP-binding protein [Beijerinckiaceae bacterium]MCZ8301680.1 ABC transporter ATP-binding protein [Beijerinckiaceae bacterium]